MKRAENWKLILLIFFGLTFGLLITSLIMFSQVRRNSAQIPAETTRLKKWIDAHKEIARWQAKRGGDIQIEGTDILTIALLEKTAQEIGIDDQIQNTQPREMKLKEHKKTYVRMTIKAISVQELASYLFSIESKHPAIKTEEISIFPLKTSPASPAGGSDLWNALVIVSCYTKNQ